MTTRTVRSDVIADSTPDSTGQLTFVDVIARPYQSAAELQISTASFRAQMRHKVDEVKVLRAKLDEMRRTVERLESALDSERREHQHKTALLNSMIQSKLLQ